MSATVHPGDYSLGGDYETRPWLCAQCGRMLARICGGSIISDAGMHLMIAVNRAGLAEIQCVCGWWSQWFQGQPHRPPEPVA